jgi:GNAT superfamily N-acetyltransferase
MGSKIDVETATTIVKSTYDSLIKYKLGFESQFIDGINLLVKINPLKIKIDFSSGNENVSGFSLIEQPNCCAIMISTQTYVTARFQKLGIAQEMLEFKESIAKAFGYSMLLCTVNVSGNPAEVHILEKHGWIKGSEVKNKRTTNIVAVFTKVL